MSTIDLLHSHLSGAATPEDLDILDAALAKDPVLAREFAEAARIDAQLAARFAPNRTVLPMVAELQGQAHTSPAPRGDTKGGQRLRPDLVPPARQVAAPRRAGTWMRAAAAILVALGLMAATIGWLNHQHEVSSSGSHAAPTPRQGKFPSDGQGGAFPKPPSFAKHQESPETRALRQRLERYHLTNLGLEQAVPLSEALQRLMARARELNHLHRPVIDTLSVAPPEGEAAMDASQTFVRLPQKSLTLMEALRLLAAQAGGEILLSPPATIRFQSLPTLDSQKIVTRTLRVRPDFVSSRTETAATPIVTHPSRKDQIHQNTVQAVLHTRKEISDYKTQLESIRNKQDEELVGAAANLGIQDPKTTAIYTNYLADQTKLRQMAQLGAGPNHPDIQALNAGLEEQRRQLKEGAKNIRSALETKLANANAVLANMEKSMEETRQKEGSPSVIAEQGKAHLPTAAPNVVARNALEDFGISFPENTGAVFDPAASSLTVTHTETALRQIEAFLAVESTQVTTTILAQAKVFEFTEGHALENTLMNSARFEEWLAEQSAREGVTLLTAPSVITRSGVDTRVEITRDSGDRAVDGQWPDWQGTKIGILATLEGEVVHLTGSAEVRRPHDLPLGQLPGKRTTPSGDLASTAVDIEAIIPPGQTALFSLSESADGPHLIGAITLKLMDPSGQVIGGDGAGESK